MADTISGHARRKRAPCRCCNKVRPHEAKGLCQSCYTRWRREGFAGDGPSPPKNQGGQRGSDHGNWRGPRATITAKHYRVRTVRGRPSSCVWGCEGAWRYEWANLTGDYDDVWDYAPMCVRCHRRYDMARRTMEPGFTRHPWGAQGILSADQVRDLRARAAAGVTHSSLAREFDVSAAVISAAIRGENYAWVRS